MQGAGLLIGDLVNDFTQREVAEMSVGLATALIAMERGDGGMVLRELARAVDTP